MHPDNIDDLFRDQLDGHATPPGPDLWARLQAQPGAEPTAETPRPERLDQLFQQRLSAHATPPARELWERLEDEHLRRRKRRAAAWWPLAMAAAVVILVLAGGAGLWLGSPLKNQSGNSVATRTHPGQKAGSNPAASGAATAAAETEAARPETATQGTSSSAETLASTTASTPKTQNLIPTTTNPKQFLTAQATRSRMVASTAPKARMSADRQSPRPTGSSRPLDAAAIALPLVARTKAPETPNPARNPTADEQHLNPAPVVAQTPTPTPPAAEIVPPDTVITVDVRNGATPAARSIRNTLSEVASAEASAERRGLGGRLLQQAGHLVRGERLSIAEATGLPENLTLRATIAGRTVSKSIQL